MYDCTNVRCTNVHECTNVQLGKLFTFLQIRTAVILIFIYLYLFICLTSVNQAVKEINEALNNSNEDALTLALSNRAAQLSGVVGDNGSWYMKMLEEKKKIKQEVF